MLEVSYHVVSGRSSNQVENYRYQIGLIKTHVKSYGGNTTHRDRDE